VDGEQPFQSVKREEIMELIAEIGQNHNGDIGLAVELIHAAKENGAEVAKFQLYDARALFPREGNEWFEYNCKTELSRAQLDIIVDECRKVNIEFMASVFDDTRIAWLEEAGVKRHKIASRSIYDTTFMRAVAATGKPLLVSLGQWRGAEFPDIPGAASVDYLYCISKYPTERSDLNFMQVDFERYAGFSDHTIGITAAMTALARGARIIEKHFTLDKHMYGPDHAGSMTPSEMKQLDTFRRECGECLGNRPAYRTQRTP
jgi:N-acetylneuraminate synthase/N,N'-diacetyllegionaminate synthase